MEDMLPNFQDQLNSLLESPVISPHICGVLARVTGLRQHNDSGLNAYILVVALIEVFLGGGPQKGTPNSFNLEAIYQAYKTAVKRFNELNKGGHRGKVYLLTKDGLMYHLKKPAFEDFAKCLFDKVFAFTHNHISGSKMLTEGQ